ncbi:hypothetical protein AC1031_016552 [Aphanomyces cochlioides]|nr:hypothetical protein AC1031_016552 [Aphanomyces cochlioides]
MKPDWVALLPDIVVKIAFSIPDAKDLLAFLKALGPYNLLGPLEYLYQLSLSRHCMDLWPVLRLRPSILGSVRKTSFEAIAKFYGDVILQEDWDNVEWLKTYLNPMAQIEWNLNVYRSRDVVDGWSDMRITRMKIDIDGYDASIMCKNILPRLTNLKSLHLTIANVNLNDFFPFLATLKQITEVMIDSDGFQLTHSDLVQLTEWFRHDTLRKLRFHRAYWGSVDDDGVKRSCFQAIFNSPMLESLEFSFCDLQDIDLSEMVYSMKSLRHINCQSTPMQVQGMSNRLKGSKLTHLELTDVVVFNDVHRLEYLLRIQPRTSIKHLALNGFNMTKPSLTSLAPLFQKCTLEKLSLCTTSITSEVAESIAAAIQKNHTIGELSLNYNEDAIPTMQLVVESVTHPNRKVKRKRIKWTSRFQRIKHFGPLESLKDLAT